jgi:hypothetical protein
MVTFISFFSVLASITYSPSIILCRDLNPRPLECESSAFITRPAILNLGHAYPQGYACRLQGILKIENLLIISPFQFFICVRSDTFGGMGVCKVLKPCFGGTQRSKIMIWGYASTKMLRTPALDHGSLPQSWFVSIFRLWTMKRRSFILFIVFKYVNFYSNSIPLNS